MSKNVDVEYDGDADRSKIIVRHESGIRIEIEADDRRHFEALHEEIFGDPESLSGAVYRDVINMETESGLSAAEVIEAARNRSIDNN